MGETTHGLHAVDICDLATFVWMEYWAVEEGSGEIKQPILLLQNRLLVVLPCSGNHWERLTNSIIQ